MSPLVLADGVLILHALFVAAVVLMVPLVLLGSRFRWRWVRSPWVRLGHLCMIGFVAGETLIGMQCPLTVWENNLRIAGGAAQGYNADGFIATGLDRLLFHPFPHWVFTVAYVAYGLLVASLLYVVPVRFPKSGAP